MKIAGAAMESKVIKKILSAFLIWGAMVAPAFSQQVITKTFSATGRTAPLRVTSGKTFTYSVTGIFSASIRLEQSLDGIQWNTLIVSTADNSGGTFSGTISADQYAISAGRFALYSFNCDSYTSGSPVVTITEGDNLSQRVTNHNNDAVFDFNDFGVKNYGYLAYKPISAPTADVGVTYYDTSANSLYISTNGSTFNQLSASDNTRVLKAGDTMTGQLTLNASTLTVQGNAFSVGASTFVVIGGNVGVLNSAPTYNLDVAGSVRRTGQDITGGTMTVQGNAFSVGGATFVVVGGNVGVGTLTPTTGFDVETPGVKLAYDLTAGSPTATGSALANTASLTLIAGSPVLQAAPSYYTKANEITVVTANNTTGWTKGSQGLMAQDTTEPVRSTASLRLATSGSGAQTRVYISTIGTSVATVFKSSINVLENNVVVYTKIQGLANLAHGYFFLSSEDLGETTPGNYVTCFFSDQEFGATYTYVEENIWERMTFNVPADCAKTGNPNLSSITSLQFAIYDNGVAGSTSTLFVGGVGFFPKQPRGTITIMEDDSYQATFSSMSAYMNKYGMRGSLYNAPAQIGASASYMSTQTLRNMAIGSNWEFALHPIPPNFSNSGAGTNDFVALSTIAILSEVQADKGWMVQNGYPQTTDGLAYPHGGENPTTRIAVRQTFSYARTIISNHMSGIKFETIPPADPYRIFSVSLTSTTTLATYEQMVSSAAAYRAHLNLLFHDMPGAGPSGASDIGFSTFTALIDFISTQNVTVLPMVEALNLTQPYQMISSMNVTGQAVIGGLFNPQGSILVPGSSSITVTGSFAISTAAAVNGAGAQNILLNSSGQTTFTPNLSSMVVSAAITGTFANTNIGPCLALSTVTLTLPTNNSLIHVDVTGAVGVNALNATIFMGLTVDGGYVDGETSSKGIIAPQETVSGDNDNVSFSTDLTGLAAGNHNICLTGAVSSGTGTIDSTNSPGLKIRAYALP